MDVPGVTGLLEDIKAAFGLPIIALVMMTLWLRFTGRSKVDSLMQRFSLIFVLALFVVFLTALMFQDRSVLIELWRQNPLLFSFVYAAFVIVMATGIVALCYWKLRPSLWKKQITE